MAPGQASLSNVVTGNEGMFCPLGPKSQAVQDPRRGQEKSLFRGHLKLKYIFGYH